LENTAMTATTFNTVQPNGDGANASFTTGYLDGEIAAETGLDPHRATAIADMADDHDPQYGTGYYEGFWARHAVLIGNTRAAAQDENEAYLAQRAGVTMTAVL
jgi:hypothetical protein